MTHKRDYQVLVRLSKEGKDILKRLSEETGAHYSVLIDNMLRGKLQVSPTLFEEIRQMANQQEKTDNE